MSTTACRRAGSPPRSIEGNATRFILIVDTSFFLHLQQDANHGTTRGTTAVVGPATFKPGPKLLGAQRCAL
jgi:hypothetical protein